MHGCLEELLAELDFLNKQRGRVTERLRELAGSERHREAVTRLRSQPGVGLITAMTFRLELVQPERFAHAGQVARATGPAWCDRHAVYYIVGLAKNTRINEMAAPLIDRARKRYEATGRKQRLFGNLRYAAHTWERPRRVIARIEHTRRGSNPRYVVTNLPGNSRQLYERIYCARGEMENRIKEQLQLFADRTSAMRWWPNQFRLLLSSLAYVLLEAIRRLGLKGTELARAQVATIRLKLLKIGAVIVRNTRRVRFLLASASPHLALFRLVAERLASG